MEPEIPILNIEGEGKPQEPTKMDSPEIQQGKAAKDSQSVEIDENVLVASLEDEHPKPKAFKESLNGASRRRLKTLLSLGHSFEQAREMCTLTFEQYNKRTQSTPQVKRLLSSDESTPGVKTPSKKRRANKGSPVAKPCSSHSRAGVPGSCKDDLELVKVGIMPSEFPEKTLSHEDLNSIQGQVEDLIFGLKDSTVVPKFRGSAFRHGYLLLTCADKATADWIKGQAKELKLPNIDIVVVDEREILSQQIITGYFPNSVECPNARIITLLENQNKDLRAAQWKVLKRTDVGKGVVELVFSVSQVSIEFLQKTNFLVDYKFNQIKLHLKEKEV